MKRLAIILTALLAVALATGAPALAAKKPKKKAPVMYQVYAEVQPLSGGSCQAGGWTVNHMVRYAKSHTSTAVVSCKATVIGRYRAGQYARACLAVQPNAELMGKECRTQRVGKGMKPFTFILNVKPAPASSGTTTGGTGTGTGGNSASQAAAQGADNKAETNQAQGCKSGDNSACSNNANANTNQQNQQQQTQVTTQVVVNVPAAPAPPPNQAPTCRIMSQSHTANKGGQLTFNATGSDPENNLITYQWSVSGASHTASDPNASSVRVTFLAAGTVTVSLRASDGHSTVDCGSITVTVVDQPMPK
jgi:hypothetical protein